MNTKDVLLQLRTKKGLSQDELAEKIHVTRQAVSRWENGETTPNTETLKLLSSFLMFQSTPCWVLPESLSANAVVCRWRILQSAKSRMAILMRSIASGVMMAAGSNIPAWSS